MAILLFPSNPKLPGRAGTASIIYSTLVSQLPKQA
jgi:hypothetical protein